MPKFYDIVDSRAALQQVPCIAPGKKLGGDACYSISFDLDLKRTCPRQAQRFCCGCSLYAAAVFALQIEYELGNIVEVSRCNCVMGDERGLEPNHVVVVPVKVGASADIYSLCLCPRNDFDFSATDIHRSPPASQTHVQINTPD